MAEQTIHMAQPVVIDYASPLVELSPILVRSARPMLMLSILSPCCVAVCFAAIAWGAAGGVLHMIVFGLTLVTAAVAGMNLNTPGQQWNMRMRMDLCAGIGLLMLMFAPAGFLLEEMGEHRLVEAIGPWWISMAYLLMCTTTVRHLWLYRDIGQWVRAVGRRKLGTSIKVMGWVKMIYEGIWLTLCAVVLAGIALGLDRRSPDDVLIFMAVGAFAGCFGYGLISIWSIVNHALIVGMTRPARR